MDAYGNYFSNWYDKFLKEQTELMKRLSKFLSIDSTKVGGLSPDQVKQLTASMEAIGKISEQNQVAIDWSKSYTQIKLPPSSPDKIAKQARDSVNSDALAALNLNIQKLNRELMGISSAHPAIKRIVKRAAELSTMQRQADTETAPEDDEAPNAVEEFVENNPEEADDIADGTQEAVRKSIKAPKDKWDSLPSESKIEIIMDAYRTASSSFFTAINSPIGIASVAEIANNIVLFLVTFVVLVHQAKNDVEESD